MALTRAEREAQIRLNSVGATRDYRQPLVEKHGQLAMPVPPGSFRSPLSEPCPKCAAPPGEECRTPDGFHRAARSHKARRRLAQRLPIRNEKTPGVESEGFSVSNEVYGAER